GVDFTDVKIVCNAGLPSDIVEALQHGGRVVRREGDKGLFIIFYEPWALSISLDDFTNGDMMDPDRPCVDHKLNCQAQDHASYSSTKLIQCKTCLCYFFSVYLDDKSPNGV
ncbi:hypothetical protein L208DRAFT_1270487, partial [Tricholoma matsutake]